MVRKEAVKEQLSAQGHYAQLTGALGKMAELAAGSIDQDSKDRFTMLSVIADKHWRIVSKYLPPPMDSTAEGVRTIHVHGITAAIQAARDRVLNLKATSNRVELEQSDKNANG